MNETEIKSLLFEICEDERVYEPGIDLMESGLMDSYAMIELFAILEDQGIEIQPTRIDRNMLRTVEGIKQLIDAAKNP